MRYLLNKLATGSEPVAFPGQPDPVVITLPDGGTRYQVTVLPERAKVHALASGAFILDLSAPPTVADVEAHLAAALVPSPLEQARATAAAAFDALPPGKQALWKPVRDAVNDALVKGDPALVVHILQTVPEIYDGMEADRAAFLALFAPHA